MCHASAQHTETTLQLATGTGTLKWSATYSLCMIRFHSEFPSFCRAFSTLVDNLIGRILEKLEISITSIHIRFDDNSSIAKVDQAQSVGAGAYLRFNLDIDATRRRSLLA